jgi:hypothetical protein
MRPTQGIKVLMLVILCVTALTPRAYTRSDLSYFYTIQMASFKQEQSARDAVDNFQQKNKDVFYRPIKISDSGTWYRLYINRYATIQAAQAGVSKLRKEGIISDAYVRRLHAKPRKQHIPSQQERQPLAKNRFQPTAVLPVESKVSPESVSAASPEVSKKQPQPDHLNIRDISVRINGKKGDSVVIQADRYFWPMTHLKHDGDKTRLQVRIQNTEPFEKDLTPQANSGRYIQNGQIMYESDRNTLVLRLDLVGAADYQVTQLYNPAENSFSLRFRK